jgi:hypothetical protein
MTTKVTISTAASDQAEDQPREREAEADEARHIRTRGAGQLRLVDAAQRHRQRKNADRHIDEEDPAPAQTAGDSAAEHRTDGDRDTRDSTEYCEWHAALTRWECLRQQRERRREHDRAAHSLERSRQ